MSRQPARPALAAATASFLVILAAGATLRAAAPADPWRSLEPGLDLGAFAAGRPPAAGDGLVRVLRIDPRRFRLVLLNASAPGQGRRQTARGWCERNDLLAAINAGMYQEDLKTNVSLMRTRDHVNNPRLTKDKAVLAFEPMDDGVPPVQIIDRECQDFEAIRGRYGTLVQGIRMVSCRGANTWSPQPMSWSTAAVGIDTQGRVLFIHVRSHYTVHDLIAVLLALPIDLKSAMYAEGGSEAQLFVRAGGQEIELVGSHAPDSQDDASRPAARPLPNVIGVARVP